MDAATVGLLSGSIGVAGTLLGSLFTQWRSDVRERNRIAAEERREEQRLARDMERDRDGRLFDYRRSTYASVIEHYHRWTTVAHEVQNGLAPQPPEDALAGFWGVVSEVSLYGSEDIAQRAIALFLAIMDLLYTEKDKDPVRDASDQYFEFLIAARAELGVPNPQQPGGTDYLPFPG